MRANELRLGNYVEILAVEFDQGIRKVFEVTETHINNIPLGESKKFGHFIKPIPLTEEWLLKFGFEDKEWTFEKESISLEWSIRRCATNERSSFFLSDKFPEELQISIIHVHQLQNLYFALTGEELTIKL